MMEKPGSSRFVPLWLVAAAALAAQPASADDAPVVSRYGFCITESEGRCLEVAVPGTVVDYERLPEDESGGRYIAFYSRQQARPGLVLVHILYGEDQDSAVSYVLPDAPGADPAALRGQLERVVAANPGTGSIVATALVAAPRGAAARGADAESFVFSRIAVPSPGEYSGKVVGLDGKTAPGTDTVSFSVIRRPPAN